jgi:hypothetical protein
MNPRWREIAVKCWDNRTDGLHFDQEMFAELIVKECMEVSLKYSHRDDDMGAIIARQIKKHFGLEK